MRKKEVVKRMAEKMFKLKTLANKITDRGPPIP